MIKNSFPKILAIGTKPILNIFEDEIEITEKLDGSQFAFGKINGKLEARSKGAQLNINNPMDLFVPAVTYVRSIEHLLPDNTIYYGEAFKRPKHNTLCYDRVPLHNIALFGVYDLLKDEWYSDYAFIKQEALRLDVEAVALLYKGKMTSHTALITIQDFLTRTSQLGGALIEGVVVKNYSRQTNIANDIYTPFMSGKYVSEAFKEVHRGRWKNEETKGGKWEVFCEGFRTPARWDKAVIHIKERGELTESPKDIGAIIQEVIADIDQEEKQYIMESLYSFYRKDLMSTATRGIPQWYKEKLLENCNGV